MLIHSLIYLRTFLVGAWAPSGRYDKQDSWINSSFICGTALTRCMWNGTDGGCQLKWSQMIDLVTSLTWLRSAYPQRRFKMGVEKSSNLVNRIFHPQADHSMCSWLVIVYMKRTQSTKLIIAEGYTHNLSSCIVKLKPEKNSGLNRLRTHDPCDTGAVLCKLNWELITLWVRNTPVIKNIWKIIYAEKDMNRSLYTQFIQLQQFV